ncbi:hypothetical protein HYE67_004652 [Fusarium culmorum]|uniref:Uncharacterized protein n=1 Tax=Fusarium culmorum TaxID=5516 RepID=A0A7S8D5V4_FUSCU|nr:hypothetical protein HYE67_004652 [Fusarium culmorum]
MVQGRGRLFGDGLPGCAARGLELKKHIFDLCFNERVVLFPKFPSFLHPSTPKLVPTTSLFYAGTVQCLRRHAGQLNSQSLGHDPPETFVVLAHAT